MENTSESVQRPSVLVKVLLYIINNLKLLSNLLSLECLMFLCVNKIIKDYFQTSAQNNWLSMRSTSDVKL